MRAMSRPVVLVPLLLLLVCQYGYSEKISTADKVRKYLGCDVAGVEPNCVKTRLSEMLELGKIFLLKVATTNYGADGPVSNITGFRFETKRPFKISGSTISVTGLNSTYIRNATLDDKGLGMTLVFPVLTMRGDFEIKGLVKENVTANLEIVDLVVTAAVRFGSSEQPTVSDVHVAMKADRMKAKFDNSALLQSMAETWLNNAKILNEKTFPWVSKAMENRLKKYLKQFVEAMK